MQRREMQRPGASKSIDERAGILRVFEGWKCGVKKSRNLKNLKKIEKSVNFKKIEKSEKSQKKSRNR